MPRELTSRWIKWWGNASKGSL